MCSRLLLGLLAGALGLTLGLSGCAPIATQGVLALDFKADTAPGARLDPARLLLDQRVPTSRLTSVRGALTRAPAGSVILACWRKAEAVNFWGPCSHVARKLGPGLLAESISPFEGGAGVYPAAHLNNRYAVIVLDVGVRNENLPAMRAEVKRLNGAAYNISNQPDTYYCSNYQNNLQRAMKLPDVVPWNDFWKMYVPAEVLLSPGTRVLWVGVQGQPETPL